MCPGKTESLLLNKWVKNASRGQVISATLISQLEQGMWLSWHNSDFLKIAPIIIL